MTLNGSKTRWTIYAAVGTLVVATLAVLTTLRVTRQEAKQDGERTGSLNERVGYIEKEQERRRQLVESIPVLTEQIQNLVHSQDELTREVKYNTQVMVRMLEEIGFTAPEKEPRSKRP